MATKAEKKNLQAEMPEASCAGFCPFGPYLPPQEQSTLAGYQEAVGWAETHPRS
jgi:hypothetical protein